MGKENKGQPSATNKSEGTGLSVNIENQNLEEDKKMTEKYLKAEDKLADSVHKMNPNRNTDKGDAINADGFN